ncbi:MAG: response regulator [Myxococcota bacterium]
MKTSILCVDDEPNILAGLRRTLRREFAVQVASSGQEGLEAAEETAFDIVISDMRMPRMDGATFLNQMKERHPKTVGILLSGQADLKDMMNLVNGGGVFRFLIKPTGQNALFTAVRDAEEWARLRNAEQELLERTLMGSLRVLRQVLAMVDPEVGGRSQQLRDVVVGVARGAGVPVTWEIEATALLAPLGMLAIGGPLAERWTSRRGIEISANLVAEIPRLEEIADAIRSQQSDVWVVRTVAMARDFLARRELGDSAQTAVAYCAALHPREHVRALLAYLSEPSPTIEIPISKLETGMRLAADLKDNAGRLLLARGTVLNAGSLARLDTFALRYGLGESIIIFSPSYDEA